ncbi:MAG: thiol reductase thioredoxin [Phycisphaera sp.]|nr:thiol reductase thioredoxin [Phycisphaera sp.]
MSNPDYFDKRADLWRRAFTAALDYDAYLADSPADKAQRWRDRAAEIPALTAEQATRVQGYRRKLNVLVYSGVWCGDCVRQGPMIKAIADAAGDGVTLRVIDRDADAELRDELRLVGAMRVPVVVFLTEDFWEVGRFGDRGLTIYRLKAQREVGATCATGLIAEPAEQLAAEQGEWVDIFERMLLMARLSPPLRQRHGD